MLRYLTAGESHGQALVVILEGLPAGLEITVEEIQAEMARRRDDVLSKGLPWLVAQDRGDASGRLLGYAYASAYRARPAYRFTVENSVYVRPGGNRRGAGRALLEALITQCTGRGFRLMIAVIGDAEVNLGSARLHALFGFTECGRIKGSGFKFNRWCDTLLMQRALNGGIDTLPV